MKFSVNTVLSLLACSLGARAATVSYDQGYDDPNRSLTAVACSDGPNGLMTRFNWQTQGQVHNFPYIGGADAVGGWNSPSCGQCFSLTYNGKTIYVLAVDRAVSGFNIALTAMNDLTNGQATFLGRVDAAAAPAAPSMCGL